MEDNTAGAAPASTEPAANTAALAPADANGSAAQDVAPATVAIVAADHEEAQGVLASLLTKFENFEHSLAADALAELNKLKALLHL